jgi:hypothetical protein
VVPGSLFLVLSRVVLKLAELLLSNVCMVHSRVQPSLRQKCLWHASTTAFPTNHSDWDESCRIKTSYLAVQDTFDETGRRVRKARVKAADKIAAHAEWVTNNPYRMPQPGQQAEGDDEDAGTADEDAIDMNGTNGMRPSSFTGGGLDSAAPSTSGAIGRSTGGEDDDEAVQISDGMHACHDMGSECSYWLLLVCMLLAMLPTGPP